MNRFQAPLVALLLAALLAACGRTPAPVAADGELATITLNTGLSGSLSNSLAPQGVPTAADGTSAVQYLEIAVLDASGTPVSFDDDNTFDPKGATSRLSLGAGVSSVTLRLPASPDEYTFRAWGYDDRDGTFLAYGETPSLVTHRTNTVMLDVHTLLDSAALTPAAPLHYIVPGQVLDLYLTVRTKGGAFTVPIKDYAADYRLAPSMGSLVSGSELGARIDVTSAAPANDFVVNADVTGWTLPDLGLKRDALPGDPSTPVPNGIVSASFSLPFLQTTGATFDLDAPTLTFDAPPAGETGKVILLSGSADDTVGIDRVRVYEGPVLIGSSAMDEYAAAGVAQIVFDGTDWSMDWTAPEGSYALNAIAIDTSGNQAEALVSSTVSTPDTTKPLLALNKVGSLQVGVPVTLSGTVSDDGTIDLIDFGIYIQLASSDPTTDLPLITIDADGTWSGSWTPTEAGTFTLQVHAFDTAKNHAFVEREVTVHPANEAPQITSTPITNATGGMPYAYDVTSFDLNGDAVTLEMTTGPAWLTLTDGEDGTATLTGTPAASDVGTHPVKLQASDGSLTDTQEFTITVAGNLAPVITYFTPSTDQFIESAIVTFNWSVGDPNLGDELICTFDPGSGNPSRQVDCDGSTTEEYYAPPMTAPGFYPSLTVSDPSGAWAKEEVSIWGEGTNDDCDPICVIPLGGTI